MSIQAPPQTCWSFTQVQSLGREAEGNLLRPRGQDEGMRRNNKPRLADSSSYLKVLFGRLTPYIGAIINLVPSGYIRSIPWFDALDRFTIGLSKQSSDNFLFLPQHSIYSSSRSTITTSSCMIMWSVDKQEESAILLATNKAWQKLCLSQIVPTQYRISFWIPLL